MATYPRRADVPRYLWTELLRGSERNVDLLAYAGLFLTEEHPDWIPTLIAKANAGVRIRLLLGDRKGEQLRHRDSEHRIGGGVTGRTEAVHRYYSDNMPPSVEIRLHNTPLYNSIYRFDNDLLINTHVYGILAAYTPTMHFRRIDGTYWDTYTESYERVWASARLPESTDL